MKGTLHKTEQGWQVSHATYDAVLGKWTAGKYPLHPSDVKQIEEDAKVFDNIEARIAAYPEVDFHIYQSWEELDNETRVTEYARLTPHVSDDFQIGPDGAYEHTEEEDVRKEALDYLVAQGQEDGLYDVREDDVVNKEKMFSKEDLINFAHFYFKEEYNSSMQDCKTTDEIFDLYIQSLKQPKQIYYEKQNFK